MFFRKKMKKSASNLDKLVTWVIIWTAVASIVWLSKTKKWQEVTTDLKKKSSWFFWRIKKMYWKSMIFFIRIFSKRKK